MQVGGLAISGSNLLSCGPQIRRDSLSTGRILSFITLTSGWCRSALFFTASYIPRVPMFTVATQKAIVENRGAHSRINQFYTWCQWVQQFISGHAVPVIWNVLAFFNRCDYVDAGGQRVSIGRNKTMKKFDVAALGSGNIDIFLSIPSLPLVAVKWSGHVWVNKLAAQSPTVPVRWGQLGPQCGYLFFMCGQWSFSLDHSWWIFFFKKYHVNCDFRSGNSGIDLPIPRLSLLMN